MNALKFAIVLAAAGFIVTGTGTFAYQAGGNKAPQPAPPVVPAEADFGKAVPQSQDTTKVTPKAAEPEPPQAKAAPVDANVNHGLAREPDHRLPGPVPLREGREEPRVLSGRPQG